MNEAPAIGWYVYERRDEHGMRYSKVEVLSAGGKVWMRYDGESTLWAWHSEYKLTPVDKDLKDAQLVRELWESAGAKS